MNDTLKCQQCGNVMEKTEKADSSLSLQLFGVVLFIVGLVLFFIPPLGTIIGIVLMIAAWRMGYKVRKVWKCKSCGYFFERA